MLATLGGLLALPLGLSLLLLPLLTPELSRPRDSAWGAVLLLLGLDLVTSADRLTGAPMLGVLCGALLIGRLGLEVGQARWRQLSEEERQRLASLERWSTSFRQLTITGAGLLERAGAGVGNLTSEIGTRAGSAGSGAGPPRSVSDPGVGAPSRSGGKRKGKRWVRPETSAASSGPGSDPAPTTAGRTGGDAATSSVQDAARTEASGSFTTAPAPEAVEGPRSPSALPSHAEPVAPARAGASPSSPSALLPAPAAPGQDPEPAAAPAAPEPSSSPPAAVADPAPLPSPSCELGSGA